MSVESVIKNAASTCGQGPHWDDATNTLLYVDIESKAIHRFQPDTGVDENIVLDDNIGFVVPARKSGLIVGLGLSIAHVDWDTKKVTKLHTIQALPGTNVNDGKCDHIGRIYAGTEGQIDPDIINMPKNASLYCVDVDGSLRKCIDNVGISVGLGWSRDNKAMYHIDCSPRHVYRYDYDVTSGQMSNRQVIVDFSGKPILDYGYPAGMTVDTEGKLWIACYYSSKVFRYDPDTGEQLQSIEFPTRRITSCCFGGRNLDELYVTSSAMKWPFEEEDPTPLSGSVFRVKGLGVKGFPANVYEGEIKPRI